MFTRPTAPLSIGGVLDAAIRLYPSSIRRWWLPSLLGAVLAAIPALFLIFLMGGTLQSPTPRAAGAATAAVAAMFRSPVTWCSYAAIVVATVWTYIAIITAINRTYIGANGGAASAMGQAIRLLPRAVLAFIGSFLAIMVGFIALVIPGLWLAGRLYFVLPVIVDEDRGALAAINRSYALTAGHWWRSFTILAVALVIVIVLSLAVGLVNGVLIATLAAHPLALLIISQSLSVVTNALTAPMLQSVVVVAYHDLVLRKDGGDLAARVGGLSAA